MRLFSRLLSAIFLLAVAGHAVAEIYTYNGPLYTAVSGTYTTAMRVTGEIETAAPLPASSASTDLSAAVTAFSFSDGLVTLDGTNAVICQFNAATDAAGVPQTVELYIRETAAVALPNTIDIFETLPLVTVGEVIGPLADPCDGAALGNNTASVRAVGVWAGSAPVAPVAIPTLHPVGLGLLVGLLVGIGAWVSRRGRFAGGR